MLLLSCSVQVAECLRLYCGLPRELAIECGMRFIWATEQFLESKLIFDQHERKIQKIYRTEAAVSIVNVLLPLVSNDLMRFEKLGADGHVLAAISALQREFGEFMSPSEYRNPEQRAAVIYKYVKKYFTGQSLLDNKLVLDDDRKQDKTDVAFNLIYRLADLLLIPRDELKGRLAVHALEAGNVDATMRHITQLLDTTLNQQSARVLYQVASQLHNQVITDTPLNARLNELVHNMACLAVCYCSTDLLVDCVELCKCTGLTVRITRQTELGEAVTRSEETFDGFSIDPYEEWCLSPCYREAGRVMEAKSVLASAGQYQSMLLAKPAPDRYPYQHYRLASQFPVIHTQSTHATTNNDQKDSVFQSESESICGAPSTDGVPPHGGGPSPIGATSQGEAPSRRRAPSSCSAPLTNDAPSPCAQSTGNDDLTISPSARSHLSSASDTSQDTSQDTLQDTWRNVTDSPSNESLSRPVSDEVQSRLAAVRQSADGCVQYLLDNDQLALAAELAVDSMITVSQIVAVQKLGYPLSEPNLKILSVEERELADWGAEWNVQFEKIMSYLLVKLFNHQFVDQTLLLSYMETFPTAKCFSIMKKYATSLGHHYRKLMDLAEVGIKYSQLVNEPKSLQTLEDLRLKAYWGRTLTKYKISFKSAFQGGPAAAEKVVCQLVRCVSSDLLMDYCKAFRLDRKRVFSNALESLLLPEPGAGGGDSCDSFIHQQRTHLAIQSISDKDVLQRQLWMILEKIAPYDYARISFLLNELNEINSSPEVTKGLRLIKFLMAYRRVSPPGEYEMTMMLENKSEEDQLMHGSRVLPPVAELRLPFHELQSGQPLKVITKELNFDTVKEWIGLAQTLNLSADHLYVLTIQNCISDHIATCRQAGTLPDGKAAPAQCNWSPDSIDQSFYKNIEDLLSKMSDCEQAVMCASWIVKELPPGKASKMAEIFV